MKYYFLFIISIAGYSLSAQQINFTPTSFSNKFSLNINSALKINSGDSVNTETIDAAGYDKNGVKRQKGGNPLTGPFYVNDAFEGDVLAITITRLSLNRSTAFTTESFSSRSVDESISKQFKKAKLVRWKLDTLTGIASIINDSSYEHLHAFNVPLKPFLGCIGVAPSNKKNEILSFFQGNFGGNMDCSFITQGATVYIPVLHDGAYLFVGDGHALQGDGEIAGNALETSLNISFAVKVIKKDSLQISFPRIENDEYIMSLGIAKKLDDAIKIATTDLVNWLQHDYNLTLQEATQVISTTIEYNIPEIADPYVEVIAKIKKELLTSLKKY
ncbi:MAG: acetamidase/formamidase family protein [Parafilimonas sp.]